MHSSKCCILDSFYIEILSDHNNSKNWCHQYLITNSRLFSQFKSKNKHSSKLGIAFNFRQLETFNITWVSVHQSQNRTIRLFKQLFLGPLEVVSSCLDPCDLLNEPLQPHPESQGLQWIVTPSSGRAEVSLVWRNMVKLVVLWWQDDVPVLHPDHKPRQLGFRSVCPLVELVCKHDEHNQNRKENVEGIVSAYLFLCLVVDHVG